MDRAIITAWQELQDDLCPKCGRPNQVHEDDKPSDYRVAFFTCTATRALDDFQSQWASGKGSGLPRAARTQAAEDKRRREAGFHPDRARSWFTYTDGEGLPSL